MKRFPEFNPRWALPRLPAPSTLSELDGFVRAGMKKEALRLARHLLKAPRIAAPTFNEALNAIMTLADRVKPWRPLVESAYERLPKRSRGAVRFWIMSIRSSCRDYEGVLRLAPKRFEGEFALVELVYGMEATFETRNRELMRKLATRLPRFVNQAEHPVGQGQLLLCLAEFYAREGGWNRTIAAAELAQNCETFLRNAVAATVEIHVARALLAVRRGLDKVAAFGKDFDPETELMLPGNDKAILEDAAKEFRRLEKRLDRIVSKERQKELGIQ